MRNIVLPFLFLALGPLFGCGNAFNKFQDAVRGFDSCYPVTEYCYGDPALFYAKPQMRALESWRGQKIETLLASWGNPARVEPIPGEQGALRYAWSEKKTVPGELDYQNSGRSKDWALVRNPDMTFECQTFMKVAADGTVTPEWVDRLGVCLRYFDPRPAAPARSQ
ncbi:MAG: hypothetical protein LBO66_02280 [Deltaproteobacteria bacterium]|jgi:hypothetical protein|nr:hypothetical protein [Deltaproteobacteria bacterium]